MPLELTQINEKNKKPFFGGDIDETQPSVFINKMSKIYRAVTGDINDIKYKGFLESTLGASNYITAFIEYTEEESDNTVVWATLDEMINKKEINGISVHESIINLFNNNAFLCNIKENNGACIANPVTMYICHKRETGELENLYNTDTDQHMRLLLIDTVEHPLFGIVYLFTTHPIDSARKKNIKRFSVFIDDSLYIMNKDEDINQYMKNTTEPDTEQQDETKKTYADYSAIRFYDNNTPIWAINNISIFVEL